MVTLLALLLLTLLRLLLARTRFVVLLAGGFVARLRRAARGIGAARLGVGRSRYRAAGFRLLSVGRRRVLRRRRLWTLSATRQSFGRFSLIIYRFFFIN